MSVGLQKTNGGVTIGQMDKCKPFEVAKDFFFHQDIQVKAIFQFPLVKSLLKKVIHP